jgi:hypothetical protein
MTEALRRPFFSPTYTTTWDEAVAAIDSFKVPALGPMREFVAAIARSPFAAGLFPSPGVHAVLIGRIPSFPPNEPHLSVHYDRGNRHFEFTYVENPFARDNWKTRVPIGRAFPHFEHLMLRRLRWFTRSNAVARSNKSLERTRDR